MERPPSSLANAFRCIHRCSPATLRPERSRARSRRCHGVITSLTWICLGIALGAGMGGAALAQGADRSVPPVGEFERLLFLASADTPLHQEVFEGLSGALPPDRQAIFTAVDAPDAALWMQSADCNRCLVITSGTRALESAQWQMRKARVLSITLPRLSHEQIMADQEADPRFAAIFIDIPLERRLEMVRRHVPALNRFAIVQSPGFGTTGDEANLREKDDPQALQRFAAENDDDLIPTFIRASRAADAIVTVPDRRIYNPRTIVSIMMTTYRQRTPLIGHSEALHRAGALMSIHSPPSALGHEAGRFIQSLRGPADWKPIRRHTGVHQVSINHQVARSLRITVEDP
ncbi:ABC transporter substrate binding protein [Ectothiorhodospira marina]|uniref:ABC transporter substrate binding protein n=2 Tax=Ectothiorhodospira marina TaxID=1396821 RepID=A0A1H7KM13_9GAMM|nr:ABC transporter substrate binding protein [Ectothiorhodospira marina]